MTQINALRDALRPHFAWHGSHLSFLAAFLTALMQVRTVNLVEIATAFDGKAKQGSKYKRLQRFFRSFELNYLEFSLAVIALMNIPEPWVLSVDRTNWKFGKANINILTLGIVHQDIAFPIMWMMLDKKGNSNTNERIELFERFFENFGHHRIDFLAADREFVGCDWFYYLLKYSPYRFRIRIKKNTKIGSGKKALQAKVIFAHLAVGETQILSGKREIWGHSLYISATRLEDNSFLIIATPSHPKTALADYAKRWPIETLFGIFKSRGFRLEDTHMTDPERVSKLFALLTLALCWCVRTGEVLSKHRSLKLKTHGRLEKSLFRYGFDRLRNIMLHIDTQADAFMEALKLFSSSTSTDDLFIDPHIIAW
jgi:hypothetical protein